MTEQPKPGPALDLAVAKALGWRLGIDADGEEFTARGPSTNNADAIAALEATGEEWVLLRYRDGVEASFPRWAKAEADTIPHAACLAILAMAEHKRMHARLRDPAKEARTIG